MRKLAAAMLVLAVGCGPAGASGSPTPAGPTTTGSPEAVGAGIHESRSNVGRNPVGSATPEQLAAVVAGDRQFAFDLYQAALAEDAGNLFISPYSISTALSMVLAGARGQTAAEVEAALGVADPQAWHAGRNRLELELVALSQQELPGNPEAVPLTLEPTNAFFGQSGYPFKNPFLDVLAANYGAGMYALDFATEPDPARSTINGLVAERTRDRIPEVLPVGSVTASTRAVLVNAIYFKANWLNTFDHAATTAGPFHALNGGTTSVPLMHGDEKRRYAAGEGWQAVELPYIGGASMLVIVPDSGQFAEIEEQIDDDFLRGIEGGLSEHQVDLRLPRWESTSALDLVTTLQSLGVELLFGPADLTGIADADLFVSGVHHAANITVDEVGTEAAAATAVMVLDSPAPPVELTVDRPFVYLIRDDANGEILFLGRVVDPTT